jgi:hypothetical protein
MLLAKVDGLFHRHLDNATVHTDAALIDYPFAHLKLFFNERYQPPTCNRRYGFLRSGYAFVVTSNRLVDLAGLVFVEDALHCSNMIGNGGNRNNSPTVPDTLAEVLEIACRNAKDVQCGRSEIFGALVSLMSDQRNRRARHIGLVQILKRCSRLILMVE